ncbi:MAG TPA: chloride channel protein [Fimbriimonadaceae bacterium]|nr:chloride channel protein [Fimbriimonadaceae bacterium]
MPAGSTSQGVLDRRTLLICAVAAIVAFAATITAKVLVLLIAFVTNLAFFGRFSTANASPASSHIGLLVFVVPAVGGIIVGLMARFGSRAIRGHGIPEVMEQILTNESRIPPKVTFLKPTSSAVAIGTGGPFGAEGPIIATGGALGSLVGQLLRTTAFERKILLAAGAAAGMTAIFGSPIAAVVLAVELLLFELRPGSIIPVAIACVVAAGARTLLFGAGPVFAMPSLQPASGGALAFYSFVGLVAGIASVAITKAVYWIEDAFERIPIHWMWYPAIGGLVVGAVGYFAPRTLGVGYFNITDLLGARVIGSAALALAACKFLSWVLALGSGTSGGTLAPLFTIGGGLGAAVGSAGIALLPNLGIDVRVAALVGMASLFGGASRALLTSIVFALETTQQPAAVLPLLAGCVAAYLVSCLAMRNTIMTEKIVRRGIRVPSEYMADYLDHVEVGKIGRKPLVTLFDHQRLDEVRDWLRIHQAASGHQGYPVLDQDGGLVGVVTRRNLLDPEMSGSSLLREVVLRPPVCIPENATLRDAADRMIREGVGRLPVTDANDPDRLVGIVTRSDILGAHEVRLREAEQAERTIQLRRAAR